MMKIESIVIAVALAISCSSAPMSERMVASEMRRCPTAADLDGRASTLKWNYTTGLELKSFLDVAIARSGLTASDPVFSYVDAWYDAIIAEDGKVGGSYKRSNYNLDHICPARTLFALYDISGKEKYRAAMDSIYLQICSQPQSFVEFGGYDTGVFWHKKIYPNQQWLDGLYMALPFYAEYCVRYIQSNTERYVNFDHIADQFRIAREKCYDPQTRLLRHAWDASRQMFWCDPVTGQSAHAWGRAMGWYMMALVDVLDFIPEDSPARQPLLDILCEMLDTLQEYDDPATGMWYQVLDCPGREGNYVESTCSAMFTYVYLKASQKGYAPQYADYARELYRKLVQNFIREEADGSISLTQCCAVAGLGGKQMRSGDYDYYIHEQICDNDPKGIGPFIWASLLYENK